MTYKNTREIPGNRVNVNHALKMENGRVVKVKLSKEDGKLLELLDYMWHESYGSSAAIAAELPKLEVEVISDTFREGITGKLLNLKQVVSAWQNKISNLRQAELEI